MARLYQWNEDTYAQTKHLPSLIFVQDIPNGVRCECGFCKEEIDIIDKETEVCPNCKADLLFPRCDW